MKLCLKIIKSQPLTYTLLAAGIAFVGFSQTTQAGFEWIPPSPAPQAAPTQPAPAQQSPTMAPVQAEPLTDDAFLPVPGSAEPTPLAEDDMSAPPTQVAMITGAFSFSGLWFTLLDDFLGMSADAILWVMFPFQIIALFVTLSLYPRKSFAVGDVCTARRVSLSQHLRTSFANIVMSMGP